LPGSWTRHGKLTHEQYFTGAGEKLGRPVGIVTFDAATKHDLRSIEKSVAALVLGIVIKLGEWPASISRYCRKFPSMPTCAHRRMIRARCAIS
jgi:hypothetical protein